MNIVALPHENDDSEEQKEGIDTAPEPGRVATDFLSNWVIDALNRRVIHSFSQRTSYLNKSGVSPSGKPTLREPEVQLEKPG